MMISCFFPLFIGTQVKMVLQLIQKLFSVILMGIWETKKKSEKKICWNDWMLFLHPTHRNHIWNALKCKILKKMLWNRFFILISLPTNTTDHFDLYNTEKYIILPIYLTNAHVPLCQQQHENNSERKYVTVTCALNTNYLSFVLKWLEKLLRRLKSIIVRSKFWDYNYYI